MLIDGEGKELKEKQRKLKELEKKLNEKKNGKKRQKRLREERKPKFEEACKKNPQLKNQLKLRANKGRPSIEADQTGKNNFHLIMQIKNIPLLKLQFIP